MELTPALVPHEYSQVITTHCVLIPCVIIFLCFSLHCWEGPISKHFTVSLQLLFTKHVTNTIWHDFWICLSRAEGGNRSCPCVEQAWEPQPRTPIPQQIRGYRWGETGGLSQVSPRIPPHIYTYHQLPHQRRAAGILLHGYYHKIRN